MRQFWQMGLLGCLFMFVEGSSFAVTRYVNVSNATPAAPYASWGAASTNIQAAIDAAASGDEILVAPGTYRIAVSLQIPLHKTLTLRSTQSRAAVVDAQRLCEVLLINGTNSVVEGFTLRNGVAVNYGGGAYLGRASTLRDCLVTSNQAWGAGGVMMQDDGAVVENCTIVSNLATYFGGGVILYDGRTGLVKDCVIADNVASNLGGGVALQRAGTVSNCWIANNRAVLENGGGAYLEQGGTLVNCVVVGNQSQERGGGAYASAAGVVANCTIASNASAQFGGGLYLENFATSRNCIVYYNAAPTNANFRATPDVAVDNCCTVPAVGTAAIPSEPAFANRDLRDFHLLPGSPCIDAGTANQAPGDDYDGNLRPAVGRPGGPALFDVGAYEYVRAAFVSADFNGDGAADVATFQPANGKWNVLYSGGGTGSKVFGSKTMVPVPADYDGDGMIDFALYERSTGFWFILNSAGGSRKATFGPNSAMVPLPGDYDGDGKADLALFYPAQARWYVFGSTEGYSSIQFGGKTDIPVPADYDGDGAVDLAVYRPANGNWYVVYSGGGSRVTQLGWAGTVPVPADYDGDGKADIAVLSRANSKWCIGYSGGGSLIATFGYKTMTPVPADYDGDGRADIAMYHAASGKWYIRQTASGIHRQVTLGGAGQIPVLLLPLIHSWFGLP